MINAFQESVFEEENTHPLIVTATAIFDYSLLQESQDVRIKYNIRLCVVTFSVLQVMEQIE